MSRLNDDITKIEGFVKTKVAALSSVAALAVGFVLGFLVKAIF